MTEKEKAKIRKQIKKAISLNGFEGLKNLQLKDSISLSLALMICVESNSIEMSKYLLELGASRLNICLRIAAYSHRDLTLAKILIKAGARDFDTALTYAKLNEDNVNMIRFFSYIKFYQNNKNYKNTKNVIFI